MAKQRADARNNEKRKGKPSFSSIRFNDSEQFTAKAKEEFIAGVIARHGGTREEATLEAFQLLDKKLNK